MKRILHRGVHHRRVTNGHNPREAAFSAEWEKENDGRCSLMTGVLQQLMVVYSDVPRRGYHRTTFGLGSGHARVAFRIRRRDAAIAATVVQWLGSNVGMSFLSESLKRCGYEVVKVKEKSPERKLVGQN